MHDMPIEVPEPARAAGPPWFTCLRSENRHAARVTVAGELDIATGSQLDHALRWAQADAPVVVLDLRGLTFMDGSGAASVLAADRRIGQAGGRLIVVNGDARVRRLFELTGLDRQLELVDRPHAGAIAELEAALV
jgi:anti-sigma B factor antagonist